MRLLADFHNPSSSVERYPVLPDIIGLPGIAIPREGVSPTVRCIEYSVRLHGLIPPKCRGPDTDLVGCVTIHSNG